VGEVAEWLKLARDVIRVGHDIFATAELRVTEKGFSDEKFLAMTLLARTLSNAKGAILLVENNRVVEARVLVRCCLENSYWIAGLATDGESFVREMLHDEMSHRRRRGQRLFSPDFTLGDDVKEKLTTWMREHGKQFKDAKQLNPLSVAGRTDIGRSYIFYEQLSSDAAHPSVDALNRYVIPHSDPEGGGIDVDPVPHSAELAETLEYLSMAAIGVLVGANQMIGGTEGGKQLNALADRYTALSNAAAQTRTTIRDHSRWDAGAAEPAADSEPDVASDTITPRARMQEG
jgi:Family of unknown function (DUF5677)